MKYYVVTKTGLDVFESNSKLQCKAYIRQAVKKGARPGSLSVVWDWPTEKRCYKCAVKESCPAVGAVIRPCPHYRKKGEE